MSLIHFSKVSALTILAVAIVACSSGGNHTKLPPNTPPLSEQDAAEKAAAEKAAAKAAAEKAAAEKAAAEKAAAEKAAAEKAAAEKAAAEKAAAEKAAADKAEKERLQKIEANRIVLLDKAKNAGLNNEQAAAYAEANKQVSATAAQTALDSIVADNAKEALLAEATAAKEGVSNTMYPIGSITAKSSTNKGATTNALTEEFRIQTVVYNQPYSVVLGNYSGNIKYNNQSGAIFNDNRDSSITIKGLKTAAAAIPTLGNATYTGKAFNGTYQNSFDWDTYKSSQKIKEGTLSYNVNFNDRTGSGSITGLGDTINLEQGTISGTGISSTAQQTYKNGSYLLDFFGKKAEEIAGKIVFDGKDTIGFGGTRGEISK